MVTNPANTLRVICPASMLANRRTLWEIGRDRNDNTSMNTISGSTNHGMPLGTNRLKKCRPFFQNP